MIPPPRLNDFGDSAMKFPTRLALPLILLASSCGYQEIKRQDFTAYQGVDTLCPTRYEGREDGFDFFTGRHAGSSYPDRIKVPIADSPVSLPFSRGTRKSVPLDKAALIKITPSRQPMDPVVASSCRAIRAEEVGPHALAEYEIWVDSRTAFPLLLSADLPPLFPGAIFLKTKFHRGAQSPYLATKMTKIANQGQASDWKYEVIELPSGRPLPCDAQKCLRCHQDWAAQDFISPEGWKALRQSQNSHLGKTPAWGLPGLPAR
jgi:hypothetical protein